MIALDRVTAVLDEHHISHALIGAAALAARGIARSTYDIDLLTTGLRAFDRRRDRIAHTPAGTMGGPSARLI